MVRGRLVAHPWARGSCLPPAASYQAERLTSTVNMDDVFFQFADCTLLYFRLHFWQRQELSEKMPLWIKRQLIIYAETYCLTLLRCIRPIDFLRDSSVSVCVTYEFGVTGNRQTVWVLSHVWTHGLGSHAFQGTACLQTALGKVFFWCCGR